MQRQLLNEFLSRFPGTSAQYWYLSDGGHFENMGGYELIRRRLKLIIIVDAEADENYTFQGLAGLVQKARLDFGAEIEFLDAAELDKYFETKADPKKTRPMRAYFGTLDQLRRGTWADEPVDDPTTKEKRITLKPPDVVAFSLAHAALAKITYAKDQNGNVETGSMIVIKPTLSGDEPADVLNYYAEHPRFHMRARRINGSTRRNGRAIGNSANISGRSSLSRTTLAGLFRPSATRRRWAAPASRLSIQNSRENRGETRQPVA